MIFSISENKLPKTLLEARKVAGAATYKHINTYPSTPFEVSLFIQFIRSLKRREFVYLVCLG